MSQSSASAEPPDPSLGSPPIGGKYRVIRALGAGGMGAVYEAENTWTKRRVAVKVMHPQGARDPEQVRRFMQEAQAAARLAHDNVVDVLDMGEDDDGLFIVYEFLVGKDLRAHLRASGRLSPREALDLMVPVMEALTAAHARGIVHRDLKPENIFLAASPRGTVPKVIDFGIAKVSSASLVGDASITATGQVIGTPYYMSPEQASGESDIDARADVWSAAVVLYELLSGLLPFQSTRIGLLIAEIITGRARPLGEVAPDLPPELVRAVHGALLPRDQRYPTMQAFVDALQPFRVAASRPPGGAPDANEVSSPRTPFANVTPATPRTPEAPRTSEAPKRAAPRANPHSRQIIAVAALVTLAVTAGVLMRSSHANTHARAVVARPVSAARAAPFAPPPPGAPAPPVIAAQPPVAQSGATEAPATPARTRPSGRRHDANRTPRHPEAPGPDARAQAGPGFSAE